MPRLTERTLSRVREIEAELRTVVDGGAPPLEFLTKALPELLGVDKGMSFSFVPHDDGVRVHQPLGVRLPRGFFDSFDRYLREQRIDWTMYNPIRPEANQRNLAVGWAQLARLTSFIRGEREPPVAQVFARFGVGQDDQLRVLVCDGPSLLAWVGVFVPGSANDTQRRTLQRLVPALKRRLTVDRLLSTGDATRALFDAAFAAIAAPSFVTDAMGAIQEANPSGLVVLERDRRGLQAQIRAAVRRGGDPRFAVTRVVVRGAPDLRLVVLCPGGEVPAAQRVAIATRRWSLTRRQTEVLALLVEGLTTRTIAAHLATREGTVEAHLTAMFAKAQVESRAELVAAVWRIG